MNFYFKGRESGIIQKFNLSTCSIIDVHMSESSGIVASKISINSNSRLGSYNLNKR
jgi:hypothetical protein